MKPLFVLFIAGCTLMVVATGAIRGWRAGSSLLLGSGRIDGAAPPAPSIAPGSPRAPAPAG